LKILVWTKRDKLRIPVYPHEEIEEVFVADKTYVIGRWKKASVEVDKGIFLIFSEWEDLPKIPISLRRSPSYRVIKDFKGIVKEQVEMEW